MKEELVACANYFPVNSIYFWKNKIEKDKEYVLICKSPAIVEEIDKKIIEKVDLVIDSGPCKIGLPSKVIDLSSGKILRQSTK